MNWLNIYGDSKSVALALSQMDEGESLKANKEDAGNIRVSITNQFHRTGRASFTTRQILDEECEYVVVVTRQKGKPKAKHHRNLSVTTFRDGDICGVLRVLDGVGYLNFCYMGSNEAVSEPCKNIIEKAKKFINKHNVKQLNY